uniref:FRSS1829 n=1 Tax=Homo sapiens TaxID=9606 RepID=Q6UWG4_HUMAN|nr:FRSS1829 [Homo sapiens]
MFRSSLLFWPPLCLLSLFLLILISSIYSESCKLEIFHFACQWGRSLSLSFYFLKFQLSDSGGTCEGLFYEYIA